MDQSTIKAQEKKFGVRLSHERRQYNYRLQAGGTKQLTVTSSTSTSTTIKMIWDTSMTDYMIYSSSNGKWEVLPLEQNIESVVGTPNPAPAGAMPSHSFLWQFLKDNKFLEGRDDQPLWASNNLQISDDAPALGPWISVPQLLLRSNPVVHVV